MTARAAWLGLPVLLVAMACSRPADYRTALVLTDDASKRCEDSLSAVAYLWKDFGVDLVEEYYEKSNETLKPIDARLGQARAALGKLANGQERDLLFEHYVAADKLCGLVRSAEGYSLLTFAQRRSVLRDELAEARAKLKVLVPVTDAERASILAEYSSPFDEEERLAKEKKLHEKRTAAAAALALSKHREEEAAAAARRSAERKAFDDAEAARLQRESSAAAERVAPPPRPQAEPQAADAALTAAERQRNERQAYLARTKPEAQAWFSRSYAAADQFCTTANQFFQDLQASHFARSSECSTVQEAAAMLRDRLAGGPPEIAMLNQTILDSYGRGAAACLRHGELVAVGAFNEGQRACAMLKYRLREYGFLSN